MSNSKREFYKMKLCLTYLMDKKKYIEAYDTMVNNRLHFKHGFESAVSQRKNHTKPIFSNLYKIGNQTYFVRILMEQLEHHLKIWTQNTSTWKEQTFQVKKDEVKHIVPLRFLGSPTTKSNVRISARLLFPVSNSATSLASEFSRS